MSCVELSLNSCSILVAAQYTRFHLALSATKSRCS
ncbi:Uncharacterised protein [Vibrio cholerae]|nr:Uncharacterised protein [Vibrio cholerae]